MPLQKRDYAVIISILGGAFFLGQMYSKIDSLDPDQIKNATEAAVGKIKAVNMSTQLPPGTIVASILGPDYFLKDGREKNWRLSDGSFIPPGSRFKQIVNDLEIANAERLPDLRGLFLRGLNAGRSDGRQDRDGENRSAGDYQRGATKLPNNPFSGAALESGEHVHNHKAPRLYGADPGDHSRAKDDGSGETDPAGGHGHIVEIRGGGDKETRPANVSVYFYIKIN